MVNSKFNDFFLEVYQGRWEKLLNSLELKERKVLRRCFNDSCSLDFLWLDEENKHFPCSRDENGLLQYYAMDLASIFAAAALDVQKGDQVLDMCAAPGGKSLVLIEGLHGEGQILLNEISKGRRDSLKKVIQQYVPRDIRDCVEIKGKDGLKYGLIAKDSFDRILVDAPCSGERHLIQAPEELEKWTPKRTKRLAGKQYGLLCSAMLALKSGGSVVYSTCSISPLENDEIIRKILDKKSDMIELDLPENSFEDFAERTEFGYIFLPDRCGFGPLYFSRLKKLSASDVE